ncbi:hypothetical protein R3P38DRAFT_3232839 [Favolaschia claudopus]|uniref:Uncharacterized protein n=1 Tax=Favolaschia claudopus TaxID=2862362 RepID=A0AAV9ZJD5_9AGAR
MSVPTPGNNGAGADRESWRSPPPHLVQQPATPTGNSTFQTATSHLAPDVDNSSTARPIGSESPQSIRTRSPESGLVVTLGTDPDGGRFFYETSTGLRLRLSSDTGTLSMQDLEALHAGSRAPQSLRTPSEASDLTSEHHSRSGDGTLADGSPDSELLAVLAALDPAALTDGQRAVIQRARAAIATGRDRLLASTAITIEHHNATSEAHQALEQLREETETRMTALHSDIAFNNSKIGEHLAENLRVLRDLGTSEDAIKNTLSGYEWGIYSSPATKSLSSP